ncbi:MAG: hypothetical protein MZV65_48620 [Chromatiales bacterium]|nr:hypothetical protein [Chromatiales bacterium]
MVKTSQGTVSIDRAGQKTPASPGTSIFVGDRVRTGADGSVGITLRDDTRLTAGPESTLLITEFRFNPNTNEGGLLASLLKGTFSVITGLSCQALARQREVQDADHDRWASAARSSWWT